jgi:hypothetical protein
MPMTVPYSDLSSARTAAGRRQSTAAKARKRREMADAMRRAWVLVVRAAMAVVEEGREELVQDAFVGGAHKYQFATSTCHLNPGPLACPESVSARRPPHAWPGRGDWT